MMEITRGRTHTFSLAVKDSAGAAVNLTGKTLRLSVKKSARDADNAAVLALASPSTGIAIVSAANGTATATITPALTTSLPNFDHFCRYELVLVDGTNIYQLATGDFVIRENQLTTV
jgi:hypothetical protein